MIGLIQDYVFPATFSLLPEMMETDAAKVMLIAIGLQESRFFYRRQRGHGPATGFWQFERGGGVKGVLNHGQSRGYAVSICRELLYKPQPRPVHKAIEHNDVLACAFARLLLWTHPAPIPQDHRAAWNYYLELWRPGKPHEETWMQFFNRARILVGVA